MCDWCEKSWRHYYSIWVTHAGPIHQHSLLCVYRRGSDTTSETRVKPTSYFIANMAVSFKVKGIEMGSCENFHSSNHDR